MKFPRGAGRLSFDPVVYVDKNDEYVFSPARYAKGKILFTLRQMKREGHSFVTKTRGQRLADSTNVGGKWTNRERGYVVSPAAAERLYRYLEEGRDASFFSHELDPLEGSPESVVGGHERGENPHTTNTMKKSGRHPGRIVRNADTLQEKQGIHPGEKSRTHDRAHEASTREARLRQPVGCGDPDPLRQISHRLRQARPRRRQRLDRSGEHRRSLRIHVGRICVGKDPHTRSRLAHVAPRVRQEPKGGEAGAKEEAQKVLRPKSGGRLASGAAGEGAGQREDVKMAKRVVPMGRLSELTSPKAASTAYRSLGGEGTMNFDAEVRTFPSRDALKTFLQKEASRSSYLALGRDREWAAVVKDLVKKNMVAYPSYQRESPDARAHESGENPRTARPAKRRRRGKAKTKSATGAAGAAGVSLRARLARVLGRKG